MDFIGKFTSRGVTLKSRAAHTCILYCNRPPAPRPRVPLPTGRHGVTVTVAWGGELFWVRIGAARWRRIRQGEAVMVQSIGWHEDKSFPCQWYFDDNAEYSLIVDYGHDDSRGFCGDIQDAWICQRRPREKA